MKWIETCKARNINFNEPVFTKDSDGSFGIGKLVKKESTEAGVVFSFAVTKFDPEKKEPTYHTYTTITHVAIP